jgi:hypothetical protein
VSNRTLSDSEIQGASYFNDVLIDNTLASDNPDNWKFIGVDSKNNPVYSNIVTGEKETRYGLPSKTI